MDKNDMQYTEFNNKFIYYKNVVTYTVLFMFFIYMCMMGA